WGMEFISFVFVGLLGAVAAPRPDHSLVVHDPISALTVLPGETAALEAMDRRRTGTARATPGLYPIRVVSSDQRDSLTIQAFVLVPFSRLRGEYLNGYRIGRYPVRALRGLSIYRPPAGFIEVTRDNEEAFVSPHFQLKQFLCKQG